MSKEFNEAAEIESKSPIAVGVQAQLTRLREQLAASEAELKRVSNIFRLDKKTEPFCYAVGGPGIAGGEPFYRYFDTKEKAMEYISNGPLACANYHALYSKNGMSKLEYERDAAVGKLRESEASAAAMQELLCECRPHIETIATGTERAAKYWREPESAYSGWKVLLARIDAALGNPTTAGRELLDELRALRACLAQCRPVVSQYDNLRQSIDALLGKDGGDENVRSLYVR